MLTILNDPAGVSGRERHEWDFELSVQGNIERHLRAGGDCKVLLNGIEIDPLTDPLMNRAPMAAEFITVVRRPEGLETLGYLVLAAIAAVAVSYALMPNMNGAGTTGKDSPNNQLTGQTNIARTYQAIPDVYGYRRVWPDLIQPSTVEYIDNLKYVTEWMCISRGAGTITAVNYAETPIGDIDGASYEVFSPVPVAGYPELGSTTLLDVLETFASDEVNGQELSPGTPYGLVARSGAFSSVIGEDHVTITMSDGSDLAQIKSLTPGADVNVTVAVGEEPYSLAGTLTSYSVVGSTFTLLVTTAEPQSLGFEAGSVDITIAPVGEVQVVAGPYTLPVQCDRLRWNTVFLRGLKGTVSIKAEYWMVDSDGVEIAGTRASQVDTYADNTYDQRFYTRNATPIAGHGRYRMQFARTSPQIGDGSFDVAKLEELYAVRNYPTKVLPGVTVIRVTTKATEDATGFSDRKFNLRWQRHVRQLASDTLGPSRNFGRAMAHIWTISGNSIAELDTGRLAAINAEFGEDSPLLRFDVSLDDADMSLGERMQLAADAARCVLWRDGQKWTVTRDQARSYPELQLDYRNLAAGGESAISYAAHLPASNDGVEVEYVDEATQSKKSYVRLNIGTGAVVEGQSANPKKVKLSACATLAQAVNRAQLEARRLLYQRVSVTDTAMSDAGSLGIGSLVRWIDPNDFAGDDGLQAGEVLAITGNFLRTSEPLDWKGETEGRIMLTGANGQYLGAPVQCYPAGDLVEVAAVPSGAYVADADRQLGTRYAFAVGLTDAEVESAGLFLTTSLKPDSSSNCVLALAEYDDRIYAFD